METTGTQGPRDSLAPDGVPSGPKQHALELSLFFAATALQNGKLVGPLVSIIDLEERCTRHCRAVMHGARTLISIDIEDPLPDLDEAPPTWSDQILLRLIFQRLSGPFSGYLVCSPSQGEAHFRFVTTAGSSLEPVEQPLIDLLRAEPAWVKIFDEREQVGHFLTVLEVVRAIVTYLNACIQLDTTS